MFYFLLFSMANVSARVPATWQRSSVWFRCCPFLLPSNQGVSVLSTCSLLSCFLFCPVLWHPVFKMLALTSNFPFFDPLLSCPFTIPNASKVQTSRVVRPKGTLLHLKLNRPSKTVPWVTRVPSLSLGVVQWTALSGFISVTVTKYPDKEQLGIGRIYLAHNSRLQSIISSVSRQFTQLAVSHPQSGASPSLLGC